MIRLEDVSRTHGHGVAQVTALDGVTLEIRRGEFVAVAGPSGSGKTTLLNLIGALDDPTSGSVSIAGKALGELSDAGLSRLRLEQIGFVFQDFNLIPVLSAEENVALPLLFRRDLERAERERRVTVALEQVGLPDKSHRRPAELSAGERQRVAVARALAGRPSVVVADEPTANLDQATGTSVLELMREMNRRDETTFVYATHDPALIDRADRVVRLRDGRLDESG